ncbi:MAG: EVE domain-containing protein [Chloroflexota bacterium]|nr:EVE domain-containing protein [Chloroflexota bacterium]MDQ5865824.1 EVE domain-containing protein [Chloroflexota bacterium]
MSDTAANQKAEAPTDDTQEGPTPALRNAWWLTTRRRRSEWQSLMATGLATFCGRPRAYFESANKGDPIVLYVSKPEHAIRAIGIITDTSPTTNPKSAIQNPKSPEPWIEVQLAFEVPSPLSWRDLLAVPALSDAEPVKQRGSATLSRLSEQEYGALEALLIVRNPELAGAFASVDAGAMLPQATYPYEDDSHDTERVPEIAQTRLREQAPAYDPSQPALRPGTSSLPTVRNLAELQALTSLPLEVLEETRDLLEDTGQIVLSGPPGTGKTWLARGLASLVTGGPAGAARVRVVQFHPSTTYEDFIEGLKPQVDAWGRVTYAVIPGVFVRLCEQARNDPDHHYVLLVDEINRAPLSRVFGELLYALEYRGPQGAVELSVSAGMGRGEQFYVPENLLLVGTMNSADRSLAMVDYALRRRFRFVEIEPNPEVLDQWLAARGNSPHARHVILDLFRDTNERLTQAIDPDHRLGHTYFMLDPLTPATLDRLWRTAIKPLITEYFLPPGGEVDEYRALFAEAVAELGEEG